MWKLCRISFEKNTASSDICRDASTLLPLPLTSGHLFTRPPATATQSGSRIDWGNLPRHLCWQRKLVTLVDNLMSHIVEWYFECFFRLAIEANGTTTFRSLVQAVFQVSLLFICSRIVRKRERIAHTWFTTVLHSYLFDYALTFSDRSTRINKWMNGWVSGWVGRSSDR